MEIFSLFGSILMDTSKADASMSKSESKVKKLASAFGNGIKTAAKWGAGIVTAAAGATAGLVSMATSAASTADNIDKMSQKLGLSREAYQELDFILSQSGASVDSLKSGMKTLVTQMGKGNSAFEKLGISVKNSDGSLRDQEDVLYEVIAALQNMEDGADKTKIAQELLGKSGTELMPLLNSEAGSFEAMKEQAHELGLVMSDELVDNGVNMTDAIDQMKRSISALGTKIGGSLMPIVEKAADFITAQMPTISKIADSLIPILTGALDGLIAPLLDMAQTLLPQLAGLVTALLPQLSDVMTAITPILSALIEKLVPVAVKIIEKLLPPLVKILDALMPILDVVFALLDPILDVLILLLDPLAEILTLAADLITVLISMAKDALEPLKPIFDVLIDLLKTGLSVGLQQVADLIKNVVMPYFSGFSAYLSGDFMGAIEGFGSEFVGIFETAFSTIDSLFGTNFGKWYDEVTSFWRDAGAKLYEVLHADEINEIELQSKYGSLDTEIVQRSNQYMREGLSAAEAMEKAMNEVLDTSEKLYYFQNNLENGMNERFGTAEERYEKVSKQSPNLYTSGSGGGEMAAYYQRQGEAKLKENELPHYAAGGIAYGKTAAVIGDNQNANIDPEVVAPLSELKKILNNDEQNELLQKIYELLAEILTILGTNQPMTVNLVLKNGTKFATWLIDNINEIKRTSGREVFI